MTSAILCALAFAAALLAGRRSLVAGLGVLVCVGYVYGIVRANVHEPLAHLTFDAGVAGLYLSRGLVPRPPLPSRNAAALRLWLIVYAGWTAIVFAFPLQDLFVRLVGLRGSLFLLPFMVFGTRLTTNDTRHLAWLFAILNIGEFAVAALEFVVGIDRFFPRNEVTDLIYASNDLVEFTAYRIPATFANAHAYGGTMVMTLPWLLGAWTWRDVSTHERRLVGIAIGLSCLGVFMSASRTHAAILFVVLGVFLITGGLRHGVVITVLFLLGTLGWIVSSDERLLRFTTLGDSALVLKRIGESVNSSLLDLSFRYPLGNGLGGGGTSIPYFLRTRLGDVVSVESEYGRLLLEVGVPGVLLWFFLLGWAFTRRMPQGRSSWDLAGRIGRCCCAAYFVAAWTGTGLLTSIPQTMIFLLLFGWSVAGDMATVPRPAEQPASDSPPAFHSFADNFS